MTNKDNTATQPQLIATSRLEKSPLNVRRTIRPDGIGELKASLLAHGLMQNLVVTDAGDGLYLVIAGARRLEAIRSLQAEGKLPEDFSVPCQIVTEAHAKEMSLAENSVRLAMHPADQFEAFAELINEGQSAADVAQRFGIEESLVHKRMKLARVAPELLEEYRSDGMTLECLMAYTISDDHRRQVKVFKSLQPWQQDDPDAIRGALTEKMIESGSKLALFVGLEAYREAGGVTRSDLFSAEIFLEKPALLNRLAEKKLDAIRHELQAEGWGWIEINPERDYTLINRCTRIQPRLVNAPDDLLAARKQLDEELQCIEQAQEDDDAESQSDQLASLRAGLDEAEEKLAAFVGFDEEQKPLAGCFVSIGQDGTPFIDKGLVKPEHRRQLAKLLGDDAAGGAAERQKPKHPFPESLRRDLAMQRLHAARVEIARNPAIAHDLLLFQLAGTILGEDAPARVAELTFARPRLQMEDSTEPTKAESELASMEKSLPTGWLKAKSEATSFEAFRQLSDEEKHQLLAYCLSLTLKPKLAAESADAVTAFDAALSLTGADPAAYWRPCKDRFLIRLTREQLLALARETLGDAWAQSHASDKKAILAERLGRAFADPEKYGRTPEQVQALKTWIPACMSFAIPPAPAARKAAKVRKAA